MENKKLLTPEDVYDYVGGRVGINSIRSRMKSGEIQSFFLNGKYLTTPRDVDTWIGQIKETNNVSQTYKTKHLAYAR